MMVLRNLLGRELMLSHYFSLHISEVAHCLPPVAWSSVPTEACHRGVDAASDFLARQSVYKPRISPRTMIRLLEHFAGL